MRCEHRERISPGSARREQPDRRTGIGSCRAGVPARGDGTPDADITRSESSVKVTAPSTAPTVEPDSIFPYVCFIGCIGRNITVQCLAACAACNPGEVITLPNCAYCGVCAGPKAIQCLVECGY
jgi:hypothetical protein